MTTPRATDAARIESLERQVELLQQQLRTLTGRDAILNDPPEIRLAKPFSTGTYPEPGLADTFDMRFQDAALNVQSPGDRTATYTNRSASMMTIAHDVNEAFRESGELVQMMRQNRKWWIIGSTVEVGWGSVSTSAIPGHLAPGSTTIHRGLVNLFESLTVNAGTPTQATYGPSRQIKCFNLSAFTLPTTTFVRVARTRKGVYVCWPWPRNNTPSLRATWNLPSITAAAGFFPAGSVGENQYGILEAALAGNGVQVRIEGDYFLEAVIDLTVSGAPDVEKTCSLTFTLNSGTGNIDSHTWTLHPGTHVLRTRVRPTAGGVLEVLINSASSDLFISGVCQLLPLF